MRFVKCTLIGLMLTLVFSACKNESKPKPNPNIAPKYALTKEPQFKKEGVLKFISEDSALASIDIELANTYAKREQGLMHRRSMLESQGMLFIFDKEERQSFWMKNTHIALDIIFVNEAKRIVHIAYNCEPYSLKSIPSYEYAKYVVEVNSGYCKEKGVNIGQYIKF